jgi:hypothetical protein
MPVSPDRLACVVSTLKGRLRKRQLDDVFIPEGSEWSGICHCDDMTLSLLCEHRSSRLFCFPKFKETRAGVSEHHSIDGSNGRCYDSQVRIVRNLERSYKCFLKKPPRRLLKSKVDGRSIKLQNLTLCISPDSKLSLTALH